MSRIFKQIRSSLRQFAAIAANELRTILTDDGALLLLLFASLIYATTYSSAYGSQVLRNVPIGVVDECRSSASRTLIEGFSSGPNTYVAYEPTDMQEAERLFFERKIYGVVYIPADYEHALYGGEQAVVSIYCDASYFLMYRQVFQELVTSLGTTSAMVEFQRLVARGTNVPQAQAMTQPVVYQSHNLFNSYLGYGSFVMPAILMLILQQTLLIGIGMIGGTWREQRLYGRLHPAGSRLPILAVVTARGVVYLLIYGVISAWLLVVHYRLFHYPMNGATESIVAFMAIYLTAAIALGLALSTLFRTREQSLMLLLWSSIPLLMLSGISYPREAIPDWLYAIGRLFPSSHGIEGFIRIQSMGASLGEVLDEIRWLATLAVVYGTAACFGMRRHIDRER